MSILLEHEADPNLVDINGNTVLHLAARIPLLPVALKLLEHEANINAQNKVKLQQGFNQVFLFSIHTRCKSKENFSFLSDKISVC